MLRRLGAFFLDTIQVIVFALAIFSFVYLLILQPHKIDGLSMYPNFDDGEYLLTDKVSYRFHEPQRGDVVVFKAPTSDEGTEFIKRIIGLPGEQISLKNGRFYVNGKALEEDYLSNDVFTSSGNFLEDGDNIIIPEGRFFVAGDNRPYSSDSRSWGFITKDAITGRAWLTYWPVNMAGVIEKPVYSFNP